MGGTVKLCSLTNLRHTCTQIRPGYWQNTLGIMEKMRTLLSTWSLIVHIGIGCIVKNQIIIITHAPALVNHALLSDTSKRLFYVKRKKSASVVCAPSKTFCMDVKAGNFHSSVFFEKCTILVEGSSDEYAMKGLSDRKGGLLEKNSISLVNVGGKTHIPHYISLLQEYKIPYIAMVDSDYNKDMDSVIKLEQDLEGELEKCGWKRTRDNGARVTKIPSYEAYDFMLNKIDDAKIENCMLNQIMQKAITCTTS